MIGDLRMKYLFFDIECANRDCTGRNQIYSFGYLLADGAIKGAKNSLFEAITGGITSAGMGITAAIIFGYVFSLVFKSKSKRN